MPSSYGRFSGNPKTEWLTDPGAPDRDMRLLEDFWYEDPEGKQWLAPKGSVVNGASIPRPLWSVVGSPYTDDYRCASVVHDVACDEPGVSRAKADRMFYFACMAGGCAEAQARLLYLGVRIGAWAKDVGAWAGVGRESLLYRTPPRPTVAELSMLAAFHQAAAALNSLPEGVGFDQIEALVDRHLSAHRGATA